MKNSLPPPYHVIIIAQVFHLTKTDGVRLLIKMYVDAATKSQQGPSCAGILWVENKQTQEKKLFLGQMSNHEAEFLAVIHGLKWLKEKNKQNEFITLYTDSKVVVSTIEKGYVKNPLFAPFLQRLKFLLADFSNLSVQWQADTLHKGAHTLAQQALLQYQRENH